jgi:hypothetical protein
MIDFQCPFRSADQAHGFLQRYTEEERIADEEAFHAGEKLMQGIDVRSNLRLVYRRKRQPFSQVHLVRKFLEDVEDSWLENALTAVRKAQISDEASVLVALIKLVAIPGVGITVASAILTVMHPEEFAILDKRAYRALRVEEVFRRAGIDTYLEYLTFCRHRAIELRISLRDYHRALRQHGGKRPRHTNRA